MEILPYFDKLGVLVLQKQNLFFHLLDLGLRRHLLQLQLLPGPFLSLEVSLQLLECGGGGVRTQGWGLGCDGTDRGGGDGSQTPGACGSNRSTLWAGLGRTQLLLSFIGSINID